MKRILFIYLLIFCCQHAFDQTCQTNSYLLSGYSGTTDPLTAIADNLPDPNWTIVQIPGVSSPVSIAPIVSGMPSTWGPISFAGASGGTINIGPSELNLIGPDLYSTNQPAGVYVYETEFCLSPNATNVSLNMQILADNRADIYLNGTLIFAHPTYTLPLLFNSGHEYLLNHTETNQSLFNFGGQNIIQVHVTNYNSSEDYQTPTGLYVFAHLNVAEGCVNYDCSQVPLNCSLCKSFEPTPGEEYWVSAWVKVGFADQVKSYAEGLLGPHIIFSFTNSTTVFEFFPTGEIIDGWQRIVGKFEVPAGAWSMDLTLQAHSSIDTYFDDIRIHPFNASMKSYVYDGETFWLVSELDDNNYATFYEYDEEGGLIRIKKETARGIVTIQETRSNTVKP